MGSKSRREENQATQSRSQVGKGIRDPRSAEPDCFMPARRRPSCSQAERVISHLADLETAGNLKLPCNHGAPNSQLLPTRAFLPGAGAPFSPGRAHPSAQPSVEAAAASVPRVRLSSRTLRANWFTLEPKCLDAKGPVPKSTNLTEASREEAPGGGCWGNKGGLKKKKKKN